MKTFKPYKKNDVFVHVKPKYCQRHRGCPLQTSLATLQRFSPLARHSITQRAILHRHVVPQRLMSSVPGGSGENLIYVVLCGGAFAAAGAYVYRTVSTDTDSEEVVEVAAEADVEEVAPVPVELVAEAKAEEPASLVETAAKVVAEAAEAVAEAASVVEETAGEVVAVAHEVEKIAEEVEAAAKELETPALPVVEEASAESKVTQGHTELAAASIVDKSVVVPVTEATAEVELEKQVEALIAPVAEEARVAIVVEETPIVEEVPVAPQVEDAAVVLVVEEVPVAPAVEEPDVVLVFEEVPVAPTVEEADVVPVVEEVSVAPAVEEPYVAPVVEEVPVAPAVEEVDVAPAVEEVPVTQALEEAPVSPVVEEVPVAEVAPPFAPELTKEVPVPSVAEVVVMAVEPPVVPEAIEVPLVTESSEVVAESPVEDGVTPFVAASVDEFSVEGQVVAEVTTSTETTAPPAALEEPESKNEFVVVMVEGAPKTDKKYKVLGVSPMRGRIIPAPEDKEPAEQVTGQAPPS
ncbi:hypothetical protein AMELA_G00009940 [Ameiurus melas]|uniref:Uncharacterized protein n=1 Tax=Ameiurus melas TaxID=219545 RepID=A0A7J6BHU2_AMEME|nr:hypothetical protein AMELA_G00009940 [Ameiurus melas]